MARHHQLTAYIEVLDQNANEYNNANQSQISVSSEISSSILNNSFYMKSTSSAINGPLDNFAFH
ncbi:13076_t:CDS:2 [Ambispora leptoticha]|uniref:13076_t:CDS:1 n=1 Tax=Ambispora leptoticha TaxID=144679 RepID=A0A9N8VY92_9GLOM|nr:13076_t:CDS:2 [Ambispora leptoticha]